MRPELWRQAEELFHAALDRSPETRRAFLDHACGQDTELREQVRKLPARDFRSCPAGAETPLVTCADQEGRSARYRSFPASGRTRSACRRE
jgi:hypothetical protein